MGEVKMNMNNSERLPRVIIGGILLLLATYIPMSALWVWVFVIAGLYAMLTGLAGFCLAYAIIKK